MSEKDLKNATAKSLPRFFGNITLKMIDNHLNPISGSSKNLENIKLFTPSATGGRGFVVTDTNNNANDADEDQYYVPFHQRERSAIYDYTADYTSRRTRSIKPTDRTETHSLSSKLSHMESISTFDAEHARARQRKKIEIDKEIVEISDSEAEEAEEAEDTESNFEQQLQQAKDAERAQKELSESIYVYREYNMTHEYDTRLKIHTKRQAILDTIEAYPVCIIQGSTGCGKTTQVPMYILDHHSHLSEPCNIIITQPRRIAAITVAARVCNERQWDLGSLCGYQIGLDRRYMSRDTRISYVTTGILLQKLINNDVDKYTHIIIDEVHERDIDVDFTLLSLKLLLQKCPSKKVILMSATIDCDLFASYFSNNESTRVPTIQIDASPFNVHTYYLDDLRKQPFDNYPRIHATLAKLPLVLNREEPRLNDETLELIVELLRYFDELEKEKIQSDANSKLRIIGDFAELRGSVLIFVPGMLEIQRIEETLKKKLPGGQLNIFPLHSDIAIDQQKRVFEKQQPTRRKIIISTSIAESSITVPDVKYVIDTCLTKQLWCDPVSNYTHLRVEWASKSSANQRKGRAGRVSEGLCFRLVTRRFFDAELEEQDLPAMLRCPLEKLVLNTKRLKKGEPRRVLSLAIQPPQLHDVERTILLLKEAGALSLKTNGYLNPYDGELTYAGKVMANLPIDIKLSKLILLGHTFGKLRESIIIAAALSTKSFFSRYYKSHLEAFKAKWYWSQGTNCDFIAILNAYNMWYDLRERGKFATRSEMNDWARKNMIDMHRLLDVHQLRQEIEERLKVEFNIIDNKNCNDMRAFYEKNDKNTAYDIDDPNDFERHHLILKIILAGAFYPNYFISSKIDEYDAYKSVCGKDIKSTVMIKGLPMNEGKLYHPQMMRLFEYCSKLMQIHYEDSKAYIEFKEGDDQPEQCRSSVNLGVHLAVLMRLLRVPMALRKFTDRETKERLRLFEQSRAASRFIGDSTLSLNADPLDRVNRIFFNNTFNNYDYDGASQGPRVERVPSVRNLGSSMNLFAEFLVNPEYLLQQMREFKLRVIHVVEFGRFWAQVDEEHFQANIESIQMVLNSGEAELKTVEPREMYVGMLVAARYRESEPDAEEIVYRARILRIDDAKRTVRIVYVDFGNQETKPFGQLFKLPDEMHAHPFQAFECQLTHIKANRLKCPNGVWSSAANKCFLKAIHGRQLMAKVFSVVDNVLRVEVLAKEDESWKSVNEECVESDFAEYAEESAISVMSHDRMASNLKSHVKGLNESSMDLSMCRSSLNMVSMDNFDITRDSNRNLAFRGADDEDSRLYSGEIRLNGPYSPLEVQFYPLVRICKSKTALVERESINFAQIDDDTQVPYERLLVASEVHLSAAGTKMLLRQTCLLPKIKGLMSLCCLLFAPTVEVRVSADGARYIGALCGLGYDKDARRPIYVDDDIECAFDVNIDIADMNSVNLLRTAVNMVIGSEEAAGAWTTDPKKLRNLQNLACNRLLDLIKRKRDYVPVVHFHNPGRWNQVAEKNIISVEKKSENEFYMLHNPVYLNEGI